MAHKYFIFYQSVDAIMRYSTSNLKRIEGLQRPSVTKTKRVTIAKRLIKKDSNTITVLNSVGIAVFILPTITTLQKRIKINKIF